MIRGFGFPAVAGRVTDFTNVTRRPNQQYRWHCRFGRDGSGHHGFPRTAGLHRP